MKKYVFRYVLVSLFSMIFCVSCSKDSNNLITDYQFSASPTNEESSSQGTKTTYDIYEPNNGSDSYSNISAGETQSFTIFPAGDIDWIRFVPPIPNKQYKIVIYADDLKYFVVEFWSKINFLPEAKLQTLKVTANGQASFSLLYGTGLKYYKFKVYATSKSDTGKYRIGIVQK